MTRLTTLNLPDFHRATIGFDRMFDEIERTFANSTNQGGYPPYNIVQLNDNEYVISLAVAGFSMDDLTVTQEKSTLTVEGSIPKGDEEVNYLHKGIGGRSFRREFALAEHVYVHDAGLENGMLNIHVVRDVPEEQKPKVINITNGVVKALGKK
jgi:molecular chaperone IbpA